MKIEKIKIDNFRLFKDTSINNNIKFQNTNIFYGLNGSGKTTFSTYLDCIDKNSNNSDFLASSFQIKCDVGSFEKMTNQSLKDNNILLNKIRVFNRDFVKENIRWDENLNQILISSQDIEFTDKLKKIKEDIGNNKNKEKQKNNKILENNKILKQKAKEIKENYHGKLDVTNYNITNLNKDLETIENKPSNEEFDNANQILDIKSNFSQLSDLDVNKILISNFEFLEINSILKNTSIITQHIEELENKENEGAQEFAKKGLELHKKLKNNRCFFCGSIIDNSRIDDLNKFFNDSFDNFIQKINLKKQYIDSIINNLNLYKNDIDSFKPFPDNELLNIFEKYKKDFEFIFNKYCKYLNNVINLLNSKSKSINFTTNINEFYDIENIKTFINNFNINIIKKNKNFIENLIKEKDKAKKCLKNYLIYDYKKYYDNNLKLEKELTELKNEQEIFKQEIDKINVQLANSNVACKEINSYLEYIIPNLFIKEEEITNNETGEITKIFKLIRKNNNSIAINLSEGEKTVIAFCYFIVSLDDKNYNQNEDIIIIDDPISSLDNNFLYNINNIMSRKFLNKERKNQFFLLTHNFYFFRKIYDSIKSSGLREKTSFFECAKYKNDIFINNINEKRFILKYSSEYQMLIEKIIEFDVNSEPIFIANYIRRVLEIFLSFTIPNESSIYCKYNQIVKNNKKLEKYRYLEIILNENSHTDDLAALYCNLERNPNFYKNLKMEFYEFIYLANKKHALSLIHLNEELNKKIHKDIKDYKGITKCNTQ